MRCPKCGYNSFDHLESCKKCGKNLDEHKSRFGIKKILLSSVVVGAEEVPEAEDAFETAVPEFAETTPDASFEEPAAASEPDGLEFDFMGDSEEEEELPFDELFEEAPPEDDLDETIAAPDEEEAEEEEVIESHLDDGLDEPSAFDPGEPEDLESEFGQVEVEDLEGSDLGLSESDDQKEQEESVSEDTELGRDESDLAKFEGDDTLEFAEDPDHPFERKEDLQAEEPQEAVPVEHTGQSDEALTEPPLIDPPLGQEPIPDDPFVTDEDFQEDLFADDEELPPLPDITFDERPTESLEAAFGERSFGNAPVGASDDFTLGALPIADLSDIKESEDPDASSLQETDESPELDESPEMPLEEQATSEVAGVIPPPFGRRIGAFLSDIILLGLVGLCFIIVAETALSESPEGIVPSIKTLIDLSIPYFLVVFCLTFGYFTLFHFLAGQTPGKMLTGMRVETSSGEAIAFSQAFMRSVGGLIQVIPAGLGYLSVLFNREGRGWNDRLAGTRLVDLKNLPTEPDELAEQED